jgi:DNA helicase-2/ATP-dependent DNA helicase PcrA
MKPAAKTALMSFMEVMKTIKKLSTELPARLLIEQIFHVIKYQEYLEDNFSPDEVAAKIDTVNELKNLASRYDELSPSESLMHFLEDIALITAEQEADGDAQKVVLMTIHSAK